MTKEDKKLIADCLLELASVRYETDKYDTQLLAVSQFANDLLPLFTERSNLNLYREFLMALKWRARNLRQLKFRNAIAQTNQTK
jgi:hypothetical protein